MATKARRKATAFDELEAVRSAFLELARTLLSVATTTLTAAARATTELTDEALRRLRTQKKKVA